MAYIVEGNYFGDQDKPIHIKDECLNAFNTDRIAFGRSMNFHEMCWKVPYTAGFKMPTPSVAYEYETKLKVSEFKPIMSAGADLLITKMVIDIIEELEPRVHQFFPVSVNAADGVVPEQYFLLNVSVQLMTVIPEVSKVTKTYVAEERLNMFRGLKFALQHLEHLPQLDPPFSFVISKNAAQGKHMWCEYGWDRVGQIFISDLFYKKLDEIGGFAGGLEVMFGVEER